ncbi:hypothetical protein E1A91_D01G223400v1, partial [Gossypium mustelinum]
MAILFWNCQGTVSPSFSRILKNIILNHKLNVVILMETRGSGCKVDNFIRRTVFKCSFHVEACEFSRGIWVMWGDDVYIDILEVDFKYIHMSYSNHSLYSIGSNITLSWILGGDFNVICSSDEQKSGVVKKNGHHSPFRDFIYDTGIVDLEYKGPIFTWRRESLFQILDRCL